MCYLYYMMQTDLQVPDLGEGADIMSWNITNTCVISLPQSQRYSHTAEAEGWVYLCCSVWSYSSSPFMDPEHRVVALDILLDVLVACGERERVKVMLVVKKDRISHL